MDNWKKERKTNGYYDGDPNKNEILEKNENYIVIRNTTASSKIYVKTIDAFEAASLFQEEASIHCKKNSFFNKALWTNSISLDMHTSYIVCQARISDKVPKDALTTATCIGLNIYDDSYKAFDCKRKLKKGLKKFPKVKKYYDKIETHNNKYLSNSFVFKLKKRVFANKGNDQIESDDSTIVAASSGTGFFVSTSGHMVTNNHVIDSCDGVKAHYKGKEVDAEVLFRDKGNDLAIIKANIKPEKIFAVSNEDVSLLEDIIVAGYPLGKKISASIKTSKGSVTALAGYGDNYSNFQIDAALNSGNSGGPIMDQKGNVVGVAVAKYIKEGVEGFNFGVKSSMLKVFASSNKFKFEPASTEELSNKELGQLITEATIYLECWMSVAKIKQIIQEGERQKAFFSEYK